MSSPKPEHLYHILDETQYLINSSKGLTKNQFIFDETLKRAFVRSLEIIGEAVKQLPDELKSEHDHIEWRAIAGMRDRLIHAYFGADYDIVWDAISNKIPTLQREIEKMIRVEGDE